MTRKIKSLALAFVTIAAMSMIAASGAQAGTLDHGGGASVSIFGSKLAQGSANTFTTSHGSFSCQQPTFEGTGGASPLHQLEVTATYHGCLCFGLACTIDMNGCKYTITGAGQAANTSVVQITGCTAGKTIEITAFNCVITVPEQTLTGHLVAAAAQQPPPDDITVQATGITTIKYQSHGLGCPNAHQAPQTQQTENGQFQGQTTVQARVDGGTLCPTQSPAGTGHQHVPLSQAGALVNLTTT